MAGYVGKSDVSSLNVSGPAMQMEPAPNVRQLQVDTDPYKIMPEIAYRAYHQQAQLQRAQQPMRQPRLEPVEAPQYSPQQQMQALRQDKWVSGGGMDPLEAQLKRKRAEAEIQALNESMMAAPTRQVQGFNMISGSGRDVLDPMAMSANQRKLFLPQGSQAQGGYGPGAAPSPERRELPQPPDFAQNPRTGQLFNPYATGVGVLQGQYGSGR